MDFEFTDNNKEISLVQIAIPSGDCFIFRRKTIDEYIYDLIQDPDIYKLGSGILALDQKILIEDMKMNPQGLVDSQVLGIK